jgi:hypothetical protein
MCDDDYVLASLQFHDDWFKPNYHVSIGLSTAISIIVFVVVTGSKVFWIELGDLFIGKTITEPRVELIESFPFQLLFGSRTGS